MLEGLEVREDWPYLLSDAGLDADEALALGLSIVNLLDIFLVAIIVVRMAP